ncbi:MAG: hypothetical protein WC061_08655 [Melioribacteraceae bacterium]
MINRAKNILTFLSLSFLLSCAPKNHVINKEYLEKKINGANLVIPRVDEVNFHQFSEIFNGPEIKKIKNDFSLLLSSELKYELKSVSNFSEIIYASFKAKPEFESKEFNLDGKGNISFQLPRNPIESDIAENLFILFLEDITLSIENKENDSSDPAKHYSVSTTPGDETVLNPVRLHNKTLVMKLNYCLYDNGNGNVVSFGTFSSDHKFMENSIAENLIKSAIKKFAGKVFVKTPFENN